MNTFRSILTVALVQFILCGCVVLAVNMPGTQSGFVAVNEPQEEEVIVSVIELLMGEEQAVLPELKEPVGDTGDIAPAGTEETGQVDGQNTDGAGENAAAGDGEPPAWAPDEAKRGYEWSQSGDDGPPPWAPAHAREHYEWSQSGEEGPPPWAGNRGKPE